MFALFGRRYLCGGASVVIPPSLNMKYVATMQIKEITVTKS